MVIVLTLLRQFKHSLYLGQVHVIKRTNTFERCRKIYGSEKFTPVSRGDPNIMKLDTPEFHSLFTPELNKLSELFKKYNYEIRIAGGAVRDLLSGIRPKDVDFATIATPTEMKEMFTKEEIRMINMKGEKHGTITARINDKENFEITTLRIDIVTDGRHADVEFTKDWKLDANRRDLTINSMFLDFNGNVYDYFYGYEDLMKKRIVFVGDPVLRIQEDYLRILRYFRFYGRIAETPNNHDQDTIEAIKQNVDGLERISGERIVAEWTKILTGNFGIELTKLMLECGIGKYIGLPENPDIESFVTIATRIKENNSNVRPVTLISPLLRDDNDVVKLHQRLKFSAFDRDLLFFLVQNREDLPSEKPLQRYQKFVLTTKIKVKTAHEYVCQLLMYQGKLDLLEEFEKWELPKFPVGGNDLKSHITSANKRVFGRVLDELRMIWLERDFKMSKQEILELVPKVVSEVQDELK